MTFGIHNWAQLIAALVCTGCVLSHPTRLNRLFLPFLWLVFSVEITGKLMTAALPNVKATMYNVFNGIQIVFYLFFLYLMQEPGKLQKTIPRLILLFVFFFVYNLFLLQGLHLFNSYTRLAGTVLLVLISLLTIWNISFYYSKGLSFYYPALIIICGIIAFFAVNIANESFYNYMIKTDPDSAIELYKTINHNLNVVLYGSISAGVLLEIYKHRQTPII